MRRKPVYILWTRHIDGPNAGETSLCTVYHYSRLHVAYARLQEIAARYGRRSITSLDADAETAATVYDGETRQAWYLTRHEQE
jgi:hypothetical protein